MKKVLLSALLTVSVIVGLMFLWRFIGCSEELEVGLFAYFCLSLFTLAPIVFTVSLVEKGQVKCKPFEGGLSIVSSILLYFAYLFWGWSALFRLYAVGVPEIAFAGWFVGGVIACLFLIVFNASSAALIKGEDEVKEVDISKLGMNIVFALGGLAIFFTLMKVF